MQCIELLEVLNRDITSDLVEQDKLYLYLDFHAHANINNIFMFGNNLSYHVNKS